MKISDTDNGFRALVKRAHLMGASISVGVFSGDQAEGAEAGITLLQVAQWVHFGTKNMPARPFISGWFDENEAMAKEAVRRMAEQVIAGKVTKDQALERLGQFFVGKIQARMSEGWLPANAPSTIAKKGSDVPTIDKGQLRSGIQYRVEK